MIMAFSGHWELRLVSNVYQVCCLFYLRIVDLICLNQDVQDLQDEIEFLQTISTFSYIIVDCVELKPDHA